MTILHRSKLTLNISGWRGGEGAPIMLIHGVGLRAEAWCGMIPFLLKKFTVTIVDLPGHGESAGFSTTPDLSDYTNRISEVIDSLGYPTFVVGHSMGAMIAMDIASRYSEFSSAIAPLNSVFRRSEEAKIAVLQRVDDIKINGVSDPSNTLERWFGNNPKGALKIGADECRNWLTSMNPIDYHQAYSAFAKENGPSDQALSSIKCPALFVTGSQEKNSTPAMSKKLAAGVVNGRSKIIEGAKHMMPMTHPEIVCEQLQRFYSGINGDK